MERNPNLRLYDSIRYRDLNMMKKAIKDGADFKGKKYSKETPLHWAVHFSNFHAILVLLSLGVDINIKDCEGETILHYAVAKQENQGNINLVKFLLIHGADVNCKDIEGRTPLFSAVSADNINMVELLKSWGADFKITCRDGATPLHYALWGFSNDFTDMFDYVLTNGVDVNKGDKEKITLLHIACARGNIDTILCLLFYGAEINSLTLTNETPIEWAYKEGHEDIVSLLIENGADVSHNDGGDGALGKNF